MSRSIRVPDPVYDRITREAENRDVSRGTIVEDWMEDSDNWKEVEDRIKRDML